MWSLFNKMKKPLEKKLLALKKQINCNDMMFIINLKKGKFKIVSIAARIETGDNSEYGPDGDFIKLKKLKPNKKESHQVLDYLG